MSSPDQSQPPTKKPPVHEDPVRHHVFDGIEEYDKRLPNWWLITLYASIVFAVIYWMVTQQFRHDDAGEKVTAIMLEKRAAKLAASAAFDDAGLWTLSRAPSVVAAGEAVYKTTCLSCHGDRLQGGIGFNLADATWVHGGRPTEIMQTVTNGVLVKGMPAWGPVLGPKKTSEVVAYILSKHSESEAAATPASSSVGGVGP
jgi:cytochrome c oxidase cbb3-type subunit III